MSVSSACENGLYSKPTAPISTAFVVRSGSFEPPVIRITGSSGRRRRSSYRRSTPVISGITDVADDEVELLLFEQVERVLGCGHAMRLVAAPAQDLDRQIAHGRLVVHDQDPHRCSSLPPAVTTLLRTSSSIVVSPLGAVELLDEKLDQPALSLARARDDSRVTADAELRVVHGQHLQDQRDRVRGRSAERQLASGSSCSRMNACKARTISAILSPVRCVSAMRALSFVPGSVSERASSAEPTSPTSGFEIWCSAPRVSSPRVWSARASGASVATRSMIPTRIGVRSRATVMRTPVTLESKTGILEPRV